MNIKQHNQTIQTWRKVLPVIVITLILLGSISWDVMASDSSANMSPIRMAIEGVKSLFNAEESLGLLCTDDVHGANDEPGQKDLTRMCVDSQVDPLQIQFQWDEIYGGGANTYDACNMFDTDSDGNINYSLCVRVLANSGTDLMEYYDVVLYSCGDDKPDRCTQPVTVLTPSAGTTCTVAQQNLDPFPAGTEYPQDTIGNCDIVWADVGGTNSVFVNTCSFPSGEPNSDPSDCITEPGSGFITIVKEADPDLSSAAFDFIINDGTTDVHTTTINGSGVSDRYPLLVIEGMYSVSETVPANWSLDEVSCVDPQRGQVGVPNYDLDGVFEIDLTASDDITCTFRDILLLTPEFSTSPDPVSGYVDDILQDSAQLSGGYNPTGTITFELYGPSDPTCIGDPVYTEDVTVTGSGIYNTTSGHQANMAGTWRWVAKYSGDTYNNPVSSGCDEEQVTIIKYSSTTTTIPDPTSGNVGDMLNDTAIVTSDNSPTGQVTFRLYEPGDTTCQSPVFTETVDLVGGSASTTSGYAAGLAGTWRWTASYAGDYANLSSSSGCDDELVTINKYTSSTTTLPVPTSGTVGDLLNDTATVIGSPNPTGQVTFKLYEPGDSTCESPVFTHTVSLEEDGSASTTGGYFAVPAGTYRWTADYSGDSANTASSSGCDDEQVIITKASPTITTLPDPEDGFIGTRLHDTATLTGGYSPTGTVTFRLYEPGDTTCVSPIHTETVDLEDSNATTESGFLSNQGGVWRWVAEYSGDINNYSDVSGCQDEMVTIEMYKLYLPFVTHDHVAPWCNLKAKQIAPSSYTVEAYVDWEWAASLVELTESVDEDTFGYHRIKWGDDTHTTFTGEKGEATFYHTYGISGWYEVVVMLWGTDGQKYFPCSQWVDPPPVTNLPVDH